MVEHKKILDYLGDKKILVTGHTGFKGSWLCEILLQSGAEIIGVALEPAYEHDLFHAMGLENRIAHHYIQDIRDGDAVKEIIKRHQPDILFHLAAQPLVLDSYDRPQYTYEVNVMGSIHVLEALRDVENSCTSVFITTDKVYENIEKDYAYKEDDKLGGYDPYSSSKAACEIAIASWVRSFFNEKKYAEHKKKIIRARAGNVIGGGDMADNRLIPDLYRYIKSGEALEIRRPSAVRPWQHVIEPVWAYIYMAYLMDSNTKDLPPALNIGPRSESNLSVREVMELFLQNIDHAQNIKYAEDKDLPHEAGLLMLDINEADVAMDWRPLLTAPQAIEWTAEWYMSPEIAQEKTDNQINQYLSLWDEKTKKA